MVFGSQRCSTCRMLTVRHEDVIRFALLRLRLAESLAKPIKDSNSSLIGKLIHDKHHPGDQPNTQRGKDAAEAKVTPHMNP